MSASCGSTTKDGSSPRTRGTVLSGWLLASARRFIPAHAGNRSWSSRACRRRSVHPRARGEQAAGETFINPHTGSSPRTRGTDPHSTTAANVVRFIPAHAGNRPASPAWRGRFPVHPRARGEQKSAPLARAACGGSSPRTRGTARASGTIHQPPRFIPAHAGNRTISSWAHRPRPVHPRARGEQLNFQHCAHMTFGSSPRTRGTAPAAAAEQEGVRFIPAHAGNSARSTSPRSPQPVHPRARGEQGSMACQVSSSGGSSPRTRGTVARQG